MKNKKLERSIKDLKEGTVAAIASVTLRAEVLKPLYEILDAELPDPYRRDWDQARFIHHLRQRGLSFLHGALIQCAVNLSTVDALTAVCPFIDELIDLYKEYNERLDELEDKALDFKKDKSYLQSFVFQLKLRMEAFHHKHKLPAPGRKEISMAEKYANWEHASLHEPEKEVDPGLLRVNEDYFSMYQQQPWYLALSEFEKKWFQSNEEYMAQSRCIFSCPPSGIASIPLLSNFRKHEKFLDRGITQYNYTHFRNRTLPPYDLRWNSALRKEIAASNADILINEMRLQGYEAPNPHTPVGYIGLVSPLKIGPINYFLKDNNKRFSEESKAAFLGDGKDGNRFYFNIPINAERGQMASSFKSQETKNSVGRLADAYAVIQNNNEFQENNFKSQLGWDSVCELSAIVLGAQTRSQPRNPLSPKYRDRNPEVLAACYFALGVQGLGGVTVSSCKSAKDRTAVFIIHLFAMIRYVEQYKMLPKFDDEPTDRANFVRLLKEEYLKGVQQAIAHANSYGSRGLKKGVSSLSQQISDLRSDMRNMFPSDLVAAIEAESPGRFEMECELANLNKIKLPTWPWLRNSLPIAAASTAVLLAAYYTTVHYVPAHIITNFFSISVSSGFAMPLILTGLALLGTAIYHSYKTHTLGQDLPRLDVPVDAVPQKTSYFQWAHFNKNNTEMKRVVEHREYQPIIMEMY